MDKLGSNILFKSIFPNLSINALPTEEDINNAANMPLSKWETDICVSFLNKEKGNKFELIVVPSISGGFLLRYFSNKYDANGYYFSLGNKDELNQYVEYDDGDYTIQGLIVDSKAVILALIDFIEKGGVKSEKISWINEDDIPDGMHWIISEDVM